MAKEYRGRMRIFYDLLHAVKEEPGIGTTRLLFLSNLSHDRLQQYVGELKDKRLLLEAETSGRRTYSLTDKGQSFLAEIARVRQFMSDFGLDM